MKSSNLPLIFHSWNMMREACKDLAVGIFYFNQKIYGIHYD